MILHGNPKREKTTKVVSFINKLFFGSSYHHMRYATFTKRICDISHMRFVNVAYCTCDISHMRFVNVAYHIWWYEEPKKQFISKGYNFGAFLPLWISI